MELTDDSWMYVKNTNGVIDFLGGEKPLLFHSMKSTRSSQKLKRKNKA
jgi:transcription antitermination factor NusG